MENPSDGLFSLMLRSVLFMIFPSFMFNKGRKSHLIAITLIHKKRLLSNYKGVFIKP